LYTERNTYTRTRRHTQTHTQTHTQIDRKKEKPNEGPGARKEKKKKTQNLSLSRASEREEDDRQTTHTHKQTNNGEESKKSMSRRIQERMKEEKEKEKARANKLEACGCGLLFVSLLSNCALFSLLVFSSIQTLADIRGEFSKPLPRRSRRSTTSSRCSCERRGNKVQGAKRNEGLLLVLFVLRLCLHRGWGFLIVPLVIQRPC
jgi:hypothetical protein